MKDNTKRIARIGVLAAVAGILFLIPGIPLFQDVYKLDFSTIPALLGAFSMGPLAGVMIVLIKDAIGCITSSSMYVGELADFLVSSALVVAASLWYRRRRTFKGALAGMGMGIVLMTVVGALANYYILLPFYIHVKGFPVEALIGMMVALVPAIDNLWEVVLFIAVPFNIVKGLVLCGVTALLYKRLSPLLRG